MNPKSEFKNLHNGNFHKLLAVPAITLLLGLVVFNSEAQFNDSDWISLNPGVPGVNGGGFVFPGEVNALVVDGCGNVYVGGNFTLVGTVLATNIAKWDGSKWSALAGTIQLNVHFR